MKIELSFGNKKEILNNILSYETRKSLVSGLLFVTVRTVTGKEVSYSNVFSLKVL